MDPIHLRTTVSTELRIPQLFFCNMHQPLVGIYHESKDAKQKNRVDEKTDT